MPKSQFIRDFAVGQTVNSAFVAKTKRLADFRQKPGQYLHITLSDASGEIDAKVWNNANILADRFSEGDVIVVQGKVEVYNGTLQVIVQTLRPCKESEFDLSDFVRTTNRDGDELVETIERTIAQMRNPHLKQLLQSFFDDPLFATEFFQSPAAKEMHHAYVGGLAEHVVNVLHIAGAVTRLYPQIDSDLLTTGVILHDIGKLRELSGGTTVDLTDEGKLVGHVVIGAMMVERKMNAIPNFPAELCTRVTHMILSHHGVREYGSPVLPSTFEAMALHLIENMDAQLNNFWQLLSATKDQPWTEYNRKLGRQLFVGRNEE